MLQNDLICKKLPNCFRVSTRISKLPRVAEPPAARTAGLLSMLQGSRRQLTHHGTQSPDPWSPHQELSTEKVYRKGVNLHRLVMQRTIPFAVYVSN